MPEWVGPIPDYKANASAGLQPVPDAQHFVVYNATGRDGRPNPNGTYDHGPMVTFVNDTYLMSWYNSPVDESTDMRSIAAYSADGMTWSEPFELFPCLSHNGEENGPWTILNGRLYTQSGSQDAGMHLETIQSIMRRVFVSGPHATPTLGPIFWLNRTIPSGFESLGFPTYLDMDDETRSDAEQYLASAVRTLTAFPDFELGAESTASGGMKYNERSVYLVPGTRKLVNLIRGGGPKTLYASVCDLPEAPALSKEDAFDMTLFSCRAGVGDRFLAMPEVLTSFDETSEPRICNWSAVVSSNIPDSHSRTCAAPLPDGQGVYLVGAQNPKSRDPVTLSIAADGLHFDQHWAVNFGAPPVRYPGHAKVVGFQYPGAMVHDGKMYVSYSIGKEDIGVSIFPLSSIGLDSSYGAVV